MNEPSRPTGRVEVTFDERSRQYEATPAGEFLPYFVAFGATEEEARANAQVILDQIDANPERFDSSSPSPTEGVWIDEDGSRIAPPPPGTRFVRIPDPE